MKVLDPEKRLAILSELINEKKPAGQAEVVALFKAIGVEVTQAMVSRDLQKLGVVMKRVGGKRVYSIPEKDVHTQILRLAVKDIQHNETTIVITTVSGLAPFVGDVVDGAHFDILGCLAGENAIMVIPKSIKNIKLVYEQICNYVYKGM